MKKFNSWICALSLLTLSLGCTGSTEEKSQGSVPDDTKTPVTKPDPKLFKEVEQPGKSTPGSKVGPGTGTEIDPPQAILPRGRKRVNIDQLDGMIRVATGFGWEKNNRNQFEELSRTLGKPDLIQQLEEDLSPTILFQKFLADAARSSCDRMANAELQEEGPQGPKLLVSVSREDTMATAPEKVAKNMQALLLRFHGQDVALDSPEMAPWTGLFTKALEDPTYNEGRKEGEESVAAWRLVCVAMITHPDFYTN